MEGVDVRVEPRLGEFVALINEMTAPSEAAVKLSALSLTPYTSSVAVKDYFPNWIKELSLRIRAAETASDYPEEIRESTHIPSTSAGVQFGL